MEVSEYVVENLTLPTPIDYAYEELHEIDECILSSRQVLHIVWSLICIIVNIVLIFILRKKTRDSFCFTMSYWCSSNLIYMGVWLYFGVVPELCTNYITERCFYILGIIFIHASEVHAVMILSNNIMSRIKQCSSILYVIWFIVFALIAIVFWMPVFGDIDNYLRLTLTGAVDIACLMILSTKIFIKQPKANNDLNVALASITILSTFFLWLSEIVYRYFHLSSIVILDTFIAILYGASIANLILFIYYDDSIGRYVFQKLNLKKHVQVVLTTTESNDSDVISKKEKLLAQINTSV